jgi:hypothetical protein
MAEAWYDLEWTESDGPTRQELLFLVTKVPSRSVKSLKWPGFLLATDLQRAVVSRQMLSVEKLEIPTDASPYRSACSAQDLRKATLAELSHRPALPHLRALDIHCAAGTGDGHMLASWLEGLWTRAPLETVRIRLVASDANAESQSSTVDLSPFQTEDFLKVGGLKPKPHLKELAVSCNAVPSDPDRLSGWLPKNPGKIFEGPTLPGFTFLESLNFSTHIYKEGRLRTLLSDKNNLTDLTLLVASSCTTIDLLRINLDLAPNLSRVALICGKHLSATARVKLADVFFSSRHAVSALALICPEIWEPESSGTWPVTIHLRGRAAKAVAVDLGEKEWVWDEMLRKPDMSSFWEDEDDDGNEEEEWMAPIAVESSDY